MTATTQKIEFLVNQVCKKYAKSMQFLVKSFVNLLNFSSKYDIIKKNKRDR